MEEIDEAAAWYRSRSLGTSRLFVDTIDAARLHPERYPVHERGTRHFVLPMFPYSVIYTMDDLEVVIIACFHQRRDPAEWQRRA